MQLQKSTRKTSRFINSICTCLILYKMFLEVWSNFNDNILLLLLLVNIYQTQINIKWIFLLFDSQIKLNILHQSKKNIQIYRQLYQKFKMIV